MEQVISAPVLLAAFSALIVKLLELAEVHRLPVTQRPDMKDLWYWVPCIILPLAGGFLVLLHLQSGATINPLLAMNIGITAPLVFRSAAERLTPKVIDPGAGA
ncbi:hypothetical protein N5C60_11500 [Pseudomonas mosselii]|uniref:hypothetical protein n=1 Tax=Pseudomonas mosselii TaxID=78327 RepID=UPI00244C5CE5|nr:hypothetical protein [Pseudomonas mosselii]MDH1145244.1 hypothetical protein [Pseudomonas mosselii]